MVSWIYYLEVLYMRDIKFRTWENKDENIFAVLGISWDNIVISESPDSKFTSLRDKYGKYIFIGDVISGDEI